MNKNTKNLPLNRHKQQAVGMFDKLPTSDQQFIMEVVSNFHYRTRTINPDNSLGDIKIIPKELNDMLAYITEEYFG